MNLTVEKEKLINYLPGLALAVIIGLSSRYAANWIPNLGGVTLAILVGLVIRNTFGVSSQLNSGIKFAEKKLLALAIILMGLKLELGVLSELGLEFIVIIIIMVVSAISLGFLLGKILDLADSFSLLLGIGSGICGSSAIGAAAPIVSEQEEEIGLSIGVVNLLGTIGIFLLPMLTNLLHFSAPKSGLMIGGTLQAVGQVVAAGFSVSDQVGRLATVVKMGRVLMLGPTILLFSLFLNSETAETETQQIDIPWFIVGFFAFSLIGSLNLLSGAAVNYLKTASKILLTIAMAGIGLKIDLSSLSNQGPKALLVGSLIFIGQLSLITLLIGLLL